MVKIAYSPIYKYSLPEGHRFPMMKYELLPEQLLYEGTVDSSRFFSPQAATLDQLLLTHTPDYVHRLEQQQLTRKEVRKIGFPMTKALIDRGKHIAYGTYECAIHAMSSDGVALNIAGGTHHSFAGHGEGFCVYNDIAFASNLLLAEGRVSQILVVDLDVHQGNGTAALFTDDPRVYTFSMHGAKNYPGRKEVSDLDIGLPDGTQDETYLSILAETLPRLIESVRPDFVFYLSGVDVLETDKLGRLAMSVDGCRERDRYVFEQCHAAGLPVAVAMGGGYSPDLRTIVNAHANTYREAIRVFM
jgi:acetoin utilization deacetylase AcuC-like enzyme